MEYQNIKLDKELANDINALIEYDYNGILGIESATSYWGLSTYNPQYSIILVNDNHSSNDGLFVQGGISFFFAPNINQENIVYLSKNLKITDKEQTVCDMVRYNRHEFHLFETLLNAYDGMVDIERMEILAGQYGVLDRMRKLYQEALLTEDEG